VLDLLIRAGTIVDGTASPATRGDVGVKDGRIVGVGALNEPAREILDAEGLVVAPGFIDPHTHYDAQLLWDPTASPSNLHGVTSAISGNCGFTLAPVRKEDTGYTGRMLSVVEGMPLASLEAGLGWNWETFGEYLDVVDNGLAINVGFLVGHCALRQYVMGDAALAGEPPTHAQLRQMQDLLDVSLSVGGLGFSTSRARGHTDDEGRPVSSRHATSDELLALCGVLRAHQGTTIELTLDGALSGFSNSEVDLLLDMVKVSGRPLNWNLYIIEASEEARARNQLVPSERAGSLGERVLALTMPVPAPMTQSLGEYCGLRMLPGLDEVMQLPIPDRMAVLRDSERRKQIVARADSPDAGIARHLAKFGYYQVGETFSPQNAGLSGRLVKDIALERGEDDFSTMVEVALNDDLRTVFWPTPPESHRDWNLRKEIWLSGNALIGGSDAGAHLDRMCGASYTTLFLADVLRGKQLVPLEQAVATMTAQPASFFGLHDRGKIEQGFMADLVIFDPSTVDSAQPRVVDDLPARSRRIVADSVGIEHVLVSGVETVAHGAPTGRRPGTVLRSGRDTTST
jgi:N-acyl-D-aspartate/D-glutamate deacylase